MRGSVNVLNSKASRQVLPTELSSELRVLLMWSTHRIDKARDIALGYLNRLITSFPSLMCSPSLVFAILEVLTLLRKACENEHYDEVRVVRAKAENARKFILSSLYSSTQSTSSVRNGWISRCGSSIATKSATRFLPCCKGTRRRGSMLR